MLEESKELTRSDKLKSEVSDIVDKVIDSQTSDEVKDLTALFNLAQTKKNILRAATLDELLDSISKQMLDRFNARPDSFSNNDLLSYFDRVQAGIERANKYTTQVSDLPAIQLNQQNNSVNISVNGEDDISLDREAKEHVIDFVKQLLLNSDNTIISENTIKEIEDGRKE